MKGNSLLFPASEIRQLIFVVINIINNWRERVQRVVCTQFIMFANNFITLQRLAIEVIDI
jgi:hypothetical protein